MIWAAKSKQRKEWSHLFFKEDFSTPLTKEEAGSFSYPLELDIQRVDLGIGTCHFHLAAMEKDLPGKFERLMDPASLNSGEVDYLYSWVIDKTK